MHQRRIRSEMLSFFACSVNSLCMAGIISKQVLATNSRSPHGAKSSVLVGRYKHVAPTRLDGGRREERFAGTGFIPKTWVPLRSTPGRGPRPSISAGVRDFMLSPTIAGSAFYSRDAAAMSSYFCNYRCLVAHRRIPGIVGTLPDKCESFALLILTTV